MFFHFTGLCLIQHKIQLGPANVFLKDLCLFLLVDFLIHVWIKIEVLSVGILFKDNIVLWSIPECLKIYLAIIKTKTLR